MRAVKGIYENGVITLTERVPLADNQEVTVWVPTDGESEVPPALRHFGMLSDLSPEQEKKFDEALERGIRFERKVEV